jgi:tetratricopeptide (TPR) repeat protein
MRLPLRWCVALASFLIASRAVMALGDSLSRPTSQDARDHLDRGNRLYNIGSFEEAIAEYKAGALVEPAPVFDYNLGQSNRQLGKYREALWHYDRFLHKGQPTGELRDAVIAFMAEMRTHLENKAQNMPPTGPAPTSDPGASTMAPVSATGRSSPGDAAASPMGREASTGKPPAGPSTTERDDSRDWLGWSLTGSGLIALGVSGVLFYRASQLNGQGDAETDMQARQSFYDQASSRNVAGVIVGLGGVALTTAGLIKLAIHPHAPSPSSAIHIGINSRGVFAAGSF